MNTDYKYLKTFSSPPHIDLEKFIRSPYKIKKYICDLLYLTPKEIYNKDYKFNEDDLNNYFIKYWNYYKTNKKYVQIQNGVKSQYKDSKGNYLSYDVGKYLDRVKLISKITEFDEEISDVLAESLLYFTMYMDADADKILARDIFIENSVPFQGVIYRGVNFYENSDTYEKFNKSLKDNKYTTVFSGEPQNTSWTDNYSTAYRFACGGSTVKTHGDEAVVFKCINNLRAVPISFMSSYEGESEVLSHSKSQWDILFKNEIQLPLFHVILYTCVENSNFKSKIKLSELDKNKLFLREFIIVEAIKQKKYKKEEKESLEAYADFILRIYNNNPSDLSKKDYEAERIKIYKEYEEAKKKNLYDKYHKEYIDILNSWEKKA